MDLMTRFPGIRRLLKRGENGILHIAPIWERTTDICVACFRKSLHFIFTLYTTYEQMKQSERAHRRALLTQPYTAPVEEKQEILEIRQRIEALEGILDGLGALEERLVQIENLIQLFQSSSLSRPEIASPEQPVQSQRILLTVRDFAARHGIDWSQMQEWIDKQTLAPALSAEGLPDYLLTPDQQSTVINYWRSKKVSYTACEQCPHYVLFGF